MSSTNNHTLTRPLIRVTSLTGVLRVNASVYYQELLTGAGLPLLLSVIYGGLLGDCGYYIRTSRF